MYVEFKKHFDSNIFIESERFSSGRIQFVT